MEHNLIGNKIRELRMSQNLTQAELGKVVGVSMQAVSKWERGGMPDIGVLLLMADYFDVTMDELLGRSNPMSSKLDDAIYTSLLQTSEKNAFESACNYCWAAIKGATRIPTIHDLHYSMAKSTDPQNSRCRIMTNEGIAYSLATEEAHMISIMPEPAAGFSSVLGNVEEYTALFRFLSDEDTLRLFLFIGTRPQSLFSKRLASRETNVSEAKVDRVFAAFEERGWLAQESADMDEGKVKLYRPIYRESFVFFLLYAKEIMLKPYFWFLSNASRRDKPLLNKKDE